MLECGWVVCALVHVRVCMHVGVFMVHLCMHVLVFMVSSLLCVSVCVTVCSAMCVCASECVCLCQHLSIFPAVLGHGLWTGVHAVGVCDWLHRLPSLASRCIGSGLLQALTDHCTHTTCLWTCVAHLLVADTTFTMLSLLSLYQKQHILMSKKGYLPLYKKGVSYYILMYVDGSVHN